MPDTTSPLPYLVPTGGARAFPEGAIDRGRGSLVAGELGYEPRGAATVDHEAGERREARVQRSTARQ